MKSRQTQTQLKQSFFTKSALGVLALAGMATADQPVHCYKDLVMGDWTFKISQTSARPNLFNSESVCTHEMPNKLQIIQGGHHFKFDHDMYELKLKLEDKNQCTIEGDERAPCNWTMMYDQALLIHLTDQDLVANFRYEVKDTVNRSEWKDLQTGDYDKFNSVCGRTMVGLVKHKGVNGEFSCMTGKKTSGNIYSNVVDDRQGVTMAQTHSSRNHGFSFAQTAASATEELSPVQLAQTKASSGTMRTLHDVPEQDRINFAQVINDTPNLSWTAMAYSQIDMEKLANNPKMNFAQVGRSFNPPAEVLREAQKYIKKPESIREVPKEFDWSNFEGYDFTGRMQDQGSCGSCYMIATITMLESRIKLWYGEEKELSSQFPLQCNFLTEGCHGGWGYFGGMFLEAYHTVDERDAPYEASTKDAMCSDWAGADKVASVEETYYVGGGYGMMNEEKLMTEIRANGPVLYDFNAGYEFMTYHSGVLAEQLPHGCSASALNDMSINQTSQDDLGIQYQKLTHSTLVVGWGEENGMKYWKVRNSYGGTWGQGGYFKVRKGRNDYGGEGENAGITPICHKCLNTRADKKM